MLIISNFPFRIHMALFLSTIELITADWIAPKNEKMTVLEH